MDSLAAAHSPRRVMLTWHACGADQISKPKMEAHKARGGGTGSPLECSLAKLSPCITPAGGLCSRPVQSTQPGVTFALFVML